MHFAERNGSSCELVKVEVGAYDYCKHIDGDGKASREKGGPGKPDGPKKEKPHIDEIIFA